VLVSEKGGATLSQATCVGTGIMGSETFSLKELVLVHMYMITATYIEESGYTASAMGKVL